MKSNAKFGSMETKEGIFERQKLDCNCNDCKFLFRSFEGRQKHEDNHYRWQKASFDIKRLNLLKKADEWRMKHLRGLCSKEESDEKYKYLVKEATSMKFEFNGGECTLMYGLCTLNGIQQNNVRPVSFIPETFQPETQHCFKHRRE